ncbi:hypothetical protein [Phreatobacter cathodiphilus]|uniref:Uncharacterized protein n=1 Tax=Phreatobacter cathodiphilus TaxID=1868589 RepID=A0A2S0NCM4_9HYPH|nr:hypothetical protein [Phreatobacter cathodiphilus]AVO45673.1 hypothetical protein C6569_11680 [Phreatobacter cathodiphilus]
MTMPQAPAAPVTYQPTPITVTAIDVPFTRLVGFFFKAALAAIPALIAVALVVKLIGAILFFGFGAWRYGFMGGPFGWL